MDENSVQMLERRSEKAVKVEVKRKELKIGGDFIKRDRKGLLFSTNSHVKSIAGRVLAVLGVFC